METIDELEEFIDACAARMQALIEGLDEERSAFDDTEEAEFAQLEDWVRDAKAKLERLGTIADLAGRQRRITGDSAPNQNTRTETDAWDTTGFRYGAPVAEVRGQALTAVESLRNVSDDVKDKLTDFVERSDNRRGEGAMHIIATASPTYRDAWRTAMLGDPMLLTNEHRDALVQARAITLTSGFAFPSTVDPSLLYIGDGSRNEIRQIADVRSIVTMNHDVNTIAAVTASWDAEEAEVSDDTPADDTVQIDTHKAQAFVEFTIESEQDLAGLETDLREALTRSKDDLETAAFAVGTGTGQPQGVMVGATTTVASDTAATFALVDVYALANALPPEYEADASWLADKALYNDIRQFDTSGGAALWERIGNGRPANLLGDPVYRNSSVVSAIATSNEVLAHGDFRSGYRIVDRVGMAVERVQLMIDTTNNRPNGKRGLYAYWRTGAGVTNANALRVLSIA